MNAIQRLRLAGSLALIVSLGLTSSCSEQRVAPPPPALPAAPEPPPPPPPPPKPLPPPAIDWREAPISPGDWQWSMEAGQSVARFANGQLVLSCEISGKTVRLTRPGSGDGEVPMTVLTSSVTRPLVGTASPGPPATVSVTVSAGDSLLDAIAFSRGRFAVDVAGLPTLYVPSWTEVSRVIEDCR